MSFQIKIENPKNISLYKNLSTFVKNDIKLDLFFVKEYILNPNETKLIDLGITCRLLQKLYERDCMCGYGCDDCSYEETITYYNYLMLPHFNIGKTPLRLANSIGLIDKNHSGNLIVALHNTRDIPFTIKRGECYVQLTKTDFSNILNFEII